MDLIAIYGAVLASALAVWQVVREVRERRPQLSVTGLLSLFPVAVDDLNAMADVRNTGEWKEFFPALQEEAAELIADLVSGD